MSLITRIKYYFWASYRRRLLDKLQQKYSHIYRGTVLDIGGRDRGCFQKPKSRVSKWIFADIETRHSPDMVLDVANMTTINTESIDVVNAIELFEHVGGIDKGLDECYRVLKYGGNLILSVPFLSSIHADPYDFQRWTEGKWKMELTQRGFNLEIFVVMGKYFTILANMQRVFVNSLPFPFRQFGYVFYPLLDCLVRIDNSRWVINHPMLGRFHGGYFIVAKK